MLSYHMVFVAGVLALESVKAQTVSTYYLSTISCSKMKLANLFRPLRRHQSPIIPVRVGPHAETFYIHRDILMKSEYFRKALGGSFQEAEKQAIDLPEEDVAIFSFVVAFMYEGSYQPIKPIADALGML